MFLGLLFHFGRCTRNKRYRLFTLTCRNLKRRMHLIRVLTLDVYLHLQFLVYSGWDRPFNNSSGSLSLTSMSHLHIGLTRWADLTIGGTVNLLVVCGVIHHLLQVIKLPLISILIHLRKLLPFLIDGQEAQIRVTSFIMNIFLFDKSVKIWITS